MPADETLQGRPFAIAVVAAVAAGLFALVAALVASPLLILWLNGVSVAMAAGVLWLYGPAGVAALLRGQPARTDWLIVGTLALTLAFFGSRLVSIAARDLGMTWIVDSDVLGFRVALSLAGLACLIVAPFTGGPTLAERWRHVALWSGLGALVALALLLLHRGQAHPLIAHPPIVPPLIGRA